MTYTGEHTWAGQLGHLLTLLSFAGALLASGAYWWSARRRDDTWRSVARTGFTLHAVAVLGIVGMLFTMLFNHWFEFDYVWKHSNRQMPLRYILSCFWEGQEGSFLLWTFWHVCIGLVLIRRGGTWEAPVMTVVALVQLFLASMLLGVHIGDVRIGSSPFLLIRELPENIGLPWTRIADYLTRIPQFADGRGLNPLLQNYWMVIHPPTLFLGFAATLVPFAYAIAGLWRRELQAWIAPALPWTFFGVMVLGTGILMGGAWAYEALSFGGFWAWDPVENASLVPWLTLVAAGHLMLVNRHRPTSVYTTFLLTLVTFHLVLYSTFLTRSGVLGDTSVHSFTGDGMMPGLTLFMLFFIWLAVVMLHTDRGQQRFYTIVAVALLTIGTALEQPVPAILLFLLVSAVWTFLAQRRDFPPPNEEEALWSREFWLFIGALVLLLSAAQITFSTSVPVLNLLLEPFQAPLTALADALDSDRLRQVARARLAPPGEAIAHYNKWQVPFAFIISLLSAFAQYLRYRSTDMKRFRRAIALSLVVALLVTALGVVLLDYRAADLNLILLFFATAFSAAANLDHIRTVLKGRLTNAGPSVAHVGFALVLLGALISTSRQNEMSRNTQGMDLRFLNEEFSNSTDILLYRGDTVRMGEYHVRYAAKRPEGVNLHYVTEYFRTVPASYAPGDTVKVGDMLFSCRSAHTASATFLADQPAHWAPIEEFPRRALWRAKAWSATRAGERLFTLEPFVQLNPRFGNVAEPSTKHWPHRDLYTHVRYADLAADEAEDSAGVHSMPPRLYEKQLGDTIVTPTCLILIDSLRTVRDSVTIRMLGPDYLVYALRMRVRDLYDRERWFEANPVIIYRDGRPVAGKGFDVDPLRVKFELVTVDGARVGLNVFEREYVVMQAIVFPGINILWTGCILMALGTFMAVRQRLRAMRRKA